MDSRDLRRLIEQARTGVRSAQEALVAAAQDRVYYHCLKMLRRPEDAQDAAQDVLIAMVTGLDKLRQPDAFWGWVNGITANRCRHLLSAPRREQPISQDEDGTSLLDRLETDDSGAMPEVSLERRETQQMVLEAVDALPPEQRLTVLFYYYDEMSVHAIAEAMEVSDGTVKSRLNYARRAIRKAIQSKGLYSAAPLLVLLSRTLRTDAAATAADLTGSVMARLGTAAAAGAAAGSAGAGAAISLKAAAAVLAAAVAVGGAAVGLSRLAGSDAQQVPAQLQEIQAEAEPAEAGQDAAAVHLPAPEPAEPTPEPAAPAQAEKSTPQAVPQTAPLPLTDRDAAAAPETETEASEPEMPETETPEAGTADSIVTSVLMQYAAAPFQTAAEIQSASDAALYDNRTFYVLFPKTAHTYDDYRLATDDVRAALAAVTPGVTAFPEAQGYRVERTDLSDELFRRNGTMNGNTPVIGVPAEIAGRDAAANVQAVEQALQQALLSMTASESSVTLSGYTYSEIVEACQNLADSRYPAFGGLTAADYDALPRPGGVVLLYRYDAA